MDNLFPVMLYAGITLIVILICRELFCWYSKINSRLYIQEDLLKEQKKQTEILEKLLTEQSAIKARLETLKKKSE